MNRSLTETKVLRKLGIPDFRHMTKDKVVSFVSLLPQMDPEVAKRALEQFPAFAETSLAVVNGLKDSLNTAAKSNDASMAALNAQCQGVLDVLKAELAKGDLTDEGRKLVIDGIMAILADMNRKDTENKAFLLELYRSTLAIVAFVLVLLAAPLGLKLKSPLNR